MENWLLAVIWNIQSTTSQRNKDTEKLIIGVINHFIIIGFPLSRSYKIPMAAFTTRLTTRASFISSVARRYLSSELNSHAPPFTSAPFRLVAPRGEDQKNSHVRWVFLGCPGVGKGTYASRLSNLLGVPHIATGDLVREELSSSGPLSSQVWKLLLIILSVIRFLLWILTPLFLTFDSYLILITRKIR